MFYTAELLQELEKSRFYGSIEMKFEAGKLVVIKKTETMKPDDRRDSRGVGNDRNS